MIIIRELFTSIKVGITLSIFGLLIITASIIIAPYTINQTVNEDIENRYVPKEDTHDYQNWLKNDLPGSTMQVYAFRFFHVTNADDILYNGANVSVEEKGPFLFRYHRHRIDVSISDKEASFRSREYYEPIKEYLFVNDDGTTTNMTSLDANEVNITLINPVIWAVAFEGIWDPLHTGSFDACATLKDERLALYCLNLLLTAVNTSVVEMLEGGGPKYGMFPTRTANEWLGILPDHAFESRCLSMLSSYRHEKDANWGFMYNDSQASDNETRKYVNPDRIRWDRLDLYRAQTMVTWQGHSEVVSLDEFNANNSKRNILSYGKDFAGWGKHLSIEDKNPGYLIGELTHPYVNCSEILYFWSDSAARAVKMHCIGELTILGVKVLRFVPTFDNLENNTYNLQMYYSPNLGLFNFSQMHQYSPVMISIPHFWNYSNIYDDFPLIDGVRKGNAKLDETFVDVEPRSGFVVSGAERLQLNLMTPLNDWDFEKIGLDYKIQNGLLLPLLIMEKYGQLNEKDAKMLRELQNISNIDKTIKTVGGIIGGILMLIGLIIILSCVYKNYRQVIAENEKMNLLTNDDDDNDDSIITYHSSSLVAVDLHDDSAENKDDDW